MSKWQEKREMHSEMMGAAINAGDMEAVKFHSTRIIFTTQATMATLKISELSVGDWVMCHEDKYRVMGITMFHELDLLKSSEGFRTSIDNIRPIPITAEILEKNGWRVIEKEALGDEYEYDGEKRVWDDYSIDICETKPGVFWYSWGIEYYMWRLEYVHQLQHLIRFAGVDKEINL